jgi:gentisate 1,2-dioxygenase
VYSNPSSELQVRLTYSNAAALRLLNVYRVDDAPPPPDQPLTDTAKDATKDASKATVEGVDPLVNPFGSFTVGDGDAWLMPYERLINPPTIASPALHWPWREVVEQLDKLNALGSKYRGRRLYLLYNPMTGRTNGTTPSFFATMTVRPPGIVDRPHRHVSAAINYYFSGSGFSRVDGERYDWSAGDLMFSAPGWAIHNHASNDDGPVYELTVQDQPFHIQLESLLWQEDLKEPPLLLGVDSGFATNRGELEK